ncbi:RagB/SusD family nutrient uptake outer membrane protein [Fulvivirga maritima]|uniref:RagB/SusD family nutrient uptake outer membrane protein n=1 Tax=Fulvivirga maritima TaxID=2904247 RepID=UPI001F34D780|nr:RagB/SusD family nutrient uptake outer membrane protein [Fulvivirga maritima]UII25256.1 RagB/SusD family nutrient uptake outer membrane protein [Fulvivirga maritima]
MKKIYIYIITICTFLVSSCTDDLNVSPIDPDVQTPGSVLNDLESYKQLLAKLYGGLALTGQIGPDGQGDIVGIDEGFSSYLRGYFLHQEMTTDESVIGWDDQTIKDFHDLDYGANDAFIRGMYSRIFYQITFANQFLRETADVGGLPEADQQEIVAFRAEARFLRALSYWHAMDLFYEVPFVTEEDGIGAFLPEQATSTEVFNYIESELLAINDDLVDPRQNEYARADKAAAWALLAKLYLNAELYTNQARYTDCIEYCNRIIGAGYSLDPDYSHMFLADNGNSPEFIFQIAFDGASTQSYGGTTFIIRGAVGGSMSATAFGIEGGWSGMRTTSGLVNKFDDTSGDTDSRAMFHTDGQSLEIENLSEFTDGYAITKFKNVTSTGAQGSNAQFTDTDFPVFRLADIYLTYAEAVLRGGSGGSAATALQYMNDLRERAYGDASGNITQGQLNLNYIIDERARELYWECHRRTDLVRFNLLTTNAYLWPWKGGVSEGRAVDSKYNYFPLPASDVAANPNLTQPFNY